MSCYFYGGIGIWPNNPLRRSGTGKSFWKGKQRLAWEKYSLFISLLEVLRYLFVWNMFPGKPDTQNTAGGPRNNLAEFWNSGHGFTLFVKDSVWVRLPPRGKGCWPRGPSGGWIFSAWVWIIKREKAGLTHTSWATMSAAVQGPLLGRIQCLSLSVLQLQSWHYLIMLFLNFCFISEVR